MPPTLSEILDQTRRGLPALRARRAELTRAAAACAPAPNFGAALRGEKVALIAEVKRRSPSRGDIRPDLDPAARAAIYAAHGAAAISVLTDSPYFGGSMLDLRSVVQRASLPTLRKDFVLHEDQILEARAAGAAAVLLIVRALEPARLRELSARAAELGLDALVEVHSRHELDSALSADARIIGVNSRDLDTFQIDLAAAWDLLRAVPTDCVAVAESGMASAADVRRAAAAGADAVLIGTALSAAEQPEALLAAVTEVHRHGR